MKIKSEMPLILRVHRTVQEADHHHTVFFKHKLKAKPGQFLMVWIPGVDEKPYAVAYHSQSEFGITSHTIGKWTAAFSKLKKGDKVGIRGPYGNSFSLKKNACVVGGGVGMSSVSFLIDKLPNPIVINGARSKNLLIYRKRFPNMICTTDDGSFGTKGFVTDALKEALSSKKIRCVYSCGPEVMMKAVLDLCNEHNVPCELSLERYMACGFGVCGKCALNDQLICVDGPIYNQNQLKNLSEFGVSARLKTGRKVPMKEYASWTDQ